MLSNVFLFFLTENISAINWVNLVHYFSYSTDFICQYWAYTKLAFTCSKSLRETRHCRRSGVFIINFEHILQFRAISDFEQIKLAG